MKAIRPLSLWVCLSTLSALFSGCATQPHPEPLTITIPRMKGAVQFSSDGQNWHPLKKGSECKVGMTFQTPAASFADIAFDKPPEPHRNPDAPLYAPESPRYCPIRMMENSTLKVEQAVKCTRSSWKHWSEDDHEEVIRLNLSAGSILGLALSASEDLKLDVAFTNGVATFSNHAYFVIKASGEVLILLRGTASIFLADKNMTLTLTSNHKYDPTTGSVTEISSEERSKYFRIGQPPPGPPVAEAVPPPPKPRQGSGMGGSLRKF